MTWPAVLSLSEDAEFPRPAKCTWNPLERFSQSVSQGVCCSSRNDPPEKGRQTEQTYVHINTAHSGL